MNPCTSVCPLLKVESSGDRDSRCSSIASTPVSKSHEPSIDVPVRSTLVKVKASKDQKAKNLLSSTVPTQPVANEPSQSRNGEVGAPLSESMHIRLPPKIEPSGDCGSGYLSTPVSNSLPIEVKCSKNSKAKNIRYFAFPTQPVANVSSQLRDQDMIKRPPSHNHGVVGVPLHPP